MICGSGGSKSRLAKAAGAEPAGQMRDEKLHAAVARSTYWSQNVQNTAASDHFWKLRCRKSARRCGAKHISKSKCTKHTRSGPLLAVEMSKKCAPLWREAHFEVKMYKAHHSRTTFGSWDVEKVHAVVARSTFRSQNVQNTPFSDHFWKLRCRKSARRCGAKHISKSKCTKHTIVGLLLEVEMSKKCTPLWREAHVQVKMYKAHHCRTTFGSWDVEKVHAVVARSTFRSQNVKNTIVGPLLEVQMSLRVARARDCAPCQKWVKGEGFVAFSTTTTTTHYTTLQLQLHLHYILLHYTPLHYTALNYTQLHYTTLHYTTLHSTTLHYTTLPSTTHHYITLHYTPQHYNYNYTTTLHYTPLHSTTLNYTTLLHYTTLHYTTLPSTTLHYITLHSTALQLQLHNYTPLHSTTPITAHYTTLHYTTLHYTTLHYTTLHDLPLHYTTLHYTTLHYTTTTATTTTTLHYTPLHSITLHYYITLHYTTFHYTHTTLHYTTLHWITLHHR